VDALSGEDLESGLGVRSVEQETPRPLEHALESAADVLVVVDDEE
jgi:hypothetical protein